MTGGTWQSSWRGFLNGEEVASVFDLSVTAAVLKQ